MTPIQLTQVFITLDNLRPTGLHTRTAILMLTVYQQEGLKQVEYAEILGWSIQIVNRHAISMERDSFVDLIHVDSDPRGRARAIILKPSIRELIDGLVS